MHAIPRLLCITDAKLIKPADPLASLLLQRMNRRGRGQMLPLGTA